MFILSLEGDCFLPPVVAMTACIRLGDDSLELKMTVGGLKMSLGGLQTGLGGLEMRLGGFEMTPAVVR